MDLPAPTIFLPLIYGLGLTIFCISGVTRPDPVSRERPKCCEINYSYLMENGICFDNGGKDNLSCYF